MVKFSSSINALYNVVPRFNRGISCNKTEIPPSPEWRFYRNSTMTLSEKHCVPCRKDMGALSPADAETVLKALNGWELIDAGKMLSKR